MTRRILLLKRAVLGGAVVVGLGLFGSCSAFLGAAGAEEGTEEAKAAAPSVIPTTTHTVTATTTVTAPPEPAATMTVTVDRRDTMTRTATTTAQATPEAFDAEATPDTEPEGSADRAPAQEAPTETPDVDDVATADAGGSSGPFGNCSEARAAGAAPLYRGDPGFSAKLDRDKDGVACE